MIYDIVCPKRVLSIEFVMTKNKTGEADRVLKVRHDDDIKEG